MEQSFDDITVEVWERYEAIVEVSIACKAHGSIHGVHLCTELMTVMLSGFQRLVKVCLVRMFLNVPNEGQNSTSVDYCAKITRSAAEDCVLPTR